MEALKPFGNVVALVNNWNQLYAAVTSAYVIQRQSMSGVATIEYTGERFIIRIGT
jgi:hypothetical protein